MELALFTSDGLLFLFRWIHFLAGVAWIGMLWYFNFVQGVYFGQAEPAAKTDATKKLVPIALWYFRWGAMFTFLSGWIYIAIRVYQSSAALDSLTVWLASILTGGTLGTFMWFNVWFVIWPRQKLVIAAANGTAVENLPAISRRAFLASRTNTLFSIPMLFFMGASAHLMNVMRVDSGHVGIWLIVMLVLVLLMEANALLATNGVTTKPIEKVNGVITSGFVLTLVFYVLMEVVL